MDVDDLISCPCACPTVRVIAEVLGAGLGVAGQGFLGGW
jgi:hypothetical protein